MDETDIENHCPKRSRLHLSVINAESSEKAATNLVICVFDSGGRFVDMRTTCSLRITVGIGGSRDLCVVDSRAQKEDRKSGQKYLTLGAVREQPSIY